MELRFKFLLSLLVMSSQAFAVDDINALIKQQQNADLNTFKEHKVYRQDVFSSTERKVFRLDKLPEEKNCFTLKALVLDNDFLKRKTEKAIKKEIVGRCVGSIGVVKIAAALQDFYIDAGYITTRITIPSQNISSGTLKLDVNAGKIEKIIVEHNDINPWMLPFAKEDILNIRDIEQGLENLQQEPGVDVKINIEPGTKHGYSTIRISTNREKQWSVRASYNNWGDKATGEHLTSVVGYLYNIARFSDLFYLAGTKSTTGQYQSVSGYYALPVGYWNYSLFYSSSKSRQAIPLYYTTVDYAGKSEYGSVKATRTVYRDKSRKVTGNAELIRRKASYTLNGEELVLQKRDMDNVRFGVNYTQQLANAHWDSTVSWQRFVTWFGAEKTPDMVYGNVSPVSQLVNVESRYTRQFSQTAYSAFFLAQYAPRELTLQDQMTMGDRWSVRGFENSVDLTGNSGYYLQNTFYRPVRGMNANYYVGVDAGHIRRDSVYGEEIIVGSTLGIQGNVKSLAYDSSVSMPVKYPGSMDVNKFNFNLNLSYQL
ncbi:ShlB/FhaC/HecB family hemolysin secretion/activation protein [Enterobacter cloacae]|nr:ShlB/FhaC/HecB family hemolysin secretion/activation protein [Enterobacter cloacae]HEB0909972.1 ShlB/FhaC/HecB family hemolysin secretion/activation protein [Enterobacter cloacae]HEB0914251.1 ShlB/FhaC/HecB family hemolysin secretion/activation protein [Enterobacter cloacae]HEB0930027.1 ShlB/FhaC/HecB family hemolysin secretion/activation protein [Enterobacter cloacae]HEB0934304.1 ShlB/FhaC/HecB family hemolysin secretion/activation protein [Enterobacter cloacae]